LTIPLSSGGETYTINQKKINLSKRREQPITGRKVAYLPTGVDESPLTRWQLLDVKVEEISFKGVKFQEHKGT